MKRTAELKRNTGLRRHRKGQRCWPLREVPRQEDLPLPVWKMEEGLRQAFRDAARFQGICAVAGHRGPWDAHHVVEAKWLKVNAPTLLWDPRNALRLSKRVHERHTNWVRRVPLKALRDENIAFAFSVMGAGAYDYLRRHYAGPDERIELALAEVEHVAVA